MNEPSFSMPLGYYNCEFEIKENPAHEKYFYVTD